MSPKINPVLSIGKALGDTSGNSDLFRRNPAPNTPAAASASPVGVAVRDGLTAPRKHLPAWLLYDARGSELFEQITRLPEYYVTRAEQGIFTRHADEIIAAGGERLALVELGAGSAAKTRVLISALLKRQERAAYYPIDISATAVEEAARRLRKRFRRLDVTPVVADYAEAIRKIRMLQGRKLVMFIGSSIGNYEPRHAIALLTRVREAMLPGDALLLGTDMVKPEPLLLAAYDDGAGVTAAFNLNLLCRINRELRADFDLARFQHRALWNSDEGRIEMHLVSRRAQSVSVAALDLTLHFGKGETIHTENSYKYLPAQVEAMLDASGFALERSWTDKKHWFGVHLARV